MPLAHPSTPLLKYQAQVHLDSKKGAWAVGFNQLPPYTRLFLQLDHQAYSVFKHTAHKPRYDPLANSEEPVEAYFYVSTDSSVDLINLDTLARMGFQKESLLEASSKGRKLFREANMSLKGALFAEIRSIDPTTQTASYTSSLVYVADCERNHLSAQTGEALGLRNDKSLGDLNPLYITASKTWELHN